MKDITNNIQINKINTTIENLAFSFNYLINDLFQPDINYFYCATEGSRHPIKYRVKLTRTALEYVEKSQIPCHFIYNFKTQKIQMGHKKQPAITLPIIKQKLLTVSADIEKSKVIIFIKHKGQKP